MRFTIVSGYIDLYRQGDQVRRPEKYWQMAQELLTLPYPMILFIDSGNVEKVREAREGLPTKIIEKNKEDLEYWEDVETTEKNREKFWGTWDPRYPAPVHILHNSKLLFLQHAMEWNPFESTHFLWLDFGSPETCCHGDFSLQVRNYCHNIPDKVRLHCLNWYEYHEDITRWYSERKWWYAAGAISGDIPHLRKFCRLWRQSYKEHLKKGFGHSEEFFFPWIVHHHRELFHLTYGDYKEMLANALYPTQNVERVVTTILPAMVRWQAYEEALLLCSTLDPISLTPLQKYTFWTQEYMARFRLGRRPWEPIEELCEEAEKDERLAQICKEKSGWLIPNTDYLWPLLEEKGEVEEIPDYCYDHHSVVVRKTIKRRPHDLPK